MQAELIVTVIVGSFAKFGKHMESFYDLLASVDKLGILFDIPMERQDGMLAIDRSVPAKVELNAVSYGWPGQSAVIDGITAQIETGGALAILGEGGAGKSTLIDLLYGLRSPTVGHLTIDGFDPRDIRPDILRSRIALVRDNEVFHATVEENIHLHREGIMATDVRDTLAAIGTVGARTSIAGWLRNATCQQWCAVVGHAMSDAGYNESRDRQTWPTVSGRHFGCVG